MTDSMREIAARWLHPTASGMRLPSSLPEVLPVYGVPDWQREVADLLESSPYPTMLDWWIRDVMAWGRLEMDINPEEFESTILHMADEYERRMGIRPTVIDLPNWVRGTILEQIAFTNGFTVADRRDD